MTDTADIATEPDHDEPTADTTTQAKPTAARPARPDKARTDDDAVVREFLTEQAKLRAESIRIDPELQTDIDEVCRDAFPGYDRKVVVSILIATGLGEAAPKWANDRRHISDLVRGYDPSGRKLDLQTNVLAGTSRLIQKAATEQYHGAPGMTPRMASYAIALGIRRLKAIRPVYHPSMGDAAHMILGR